jgi:hypothetical protein
MGASVYAVLEYREYDSFRSFGKIDLPRNVEFLCTIAWGDGGITDGMPYPPRDAFPADASYRAHDEFFVSAEDGEEEEAISLEEYAEQIGDWALAKFKASGLLPPPDLSNLGWLTLSELEANLAHRGLDRSKLSPPIRALLAAMNELAGAYGRDSVRLVYWLTL